MAAIELRRVDKVYANGHHAVRALDLTVQDGELLVLLGPSGCGKSTILRLIAGLEPLTGGEILLGGRRVDRDPPWRRNVAMVFQSYALYGHMSVRQNLEFPLRMAGVGRGERRRRALEVARMLELDSILDARPGSLSGGQQQRVAMGRALVREPEAFLLDEPLSNLDARLRTQLRGHIARLQERLGVTTVHVTHDQVEALSLGRRVAVLREGRIQQIGPGQELYDHPVNTFVAAFVGQPGMNLLEGRLAAGERGPEVRVGGACVPVPPRVAARAGDLRKLLGEEVVLGVRPEALRPAAAGFEGGDLSGEVQTVESLGSERILYLVPESGHRSDRSPAEGGEPGAIAVRVRGTGVVPRVGQRLALVIDPAGIRLFDASGRALDDRARSATGS